MRRLGYQSLTALQKRKVKLTELVVGSYSLDVVQYTYCTVDRRQISSYCTVQYTVQKVHELYGIQKNCDSISNLLLKSKI